MVPRAGTDHRTLGIDLAAQPRTTAACLIEWASEPRVEKLGVGLADADLVKLARAAQKSGIDAPFGWPDPFVEAVAAHARHAGWPGRAQDQEAFRRSLALARRTAR